MQARNLITTKYMRIICTHISMITALDSSTRIFYTLLLELFAGAKSTFVLAESLSSQLQCHGILGSCLLYSSNFEL